jgi:ribosome-binding protein aMBF1 (putative translation factor)
MLFVRQGWSEVNTASESAKHYCTAYKGAAQPTCHVFTNRMRQVIQCARLNARLTALDLANLIGISESDLLAIENGTKFPTNEIMHSLQNQLRVEILPV